MRFLSDIYDDDSICFCWTAQHSNSPILFTGADKADFYEELSTMIREMIYRLNDDDVAVLKANHAAFSALSKHVPAEELVEHVEYAKNLLANMVSDARRRKGGVGDGVFLLPGFNMPKGTTADCFLFHELKLLTDFL